MLIQCRIRAVGWCGVFYATAMLIAGGCGATTGDVLSGNSVANAGGATDELTDSWLGLDGLQRDDVHQIIAAARASSFDIAATNADAATDAEGGVAGTGVMTRKLQDAVQTLVPPPGTLVPEDVTHRAIDQVIEALFVSNLWILPTPAGTQGQCSLTGGACTSDDECELFPEEFCLFDDPVQNAVELAEQMLGEAIGALDQHVRSDEFGTDTTKAAAWDARNFLQLFQEAQQVIGGLTLGCDPQNLRADTCGPLLADDEGGVDIDLVYPGFSRQVRSPFYIGAATSNIIQEQVIVPDAIGEGDCVVVLKEIQGVKAVVRRKLIPIWVEPWFARARIVGYRVVWVWEFIPAEFLKTISYCNAGGSVVQDVNIRVVIERQLLHFWSFLNKNVQLSP